MCSEVLEDLARFVRGSPNFRQVPAKEPHPTRLRFRSHRNGWHMLRRKAALSDVAGIVSTSRETLGD